MVPASSRVVAAWGTCFHGKSCRAALQSGSLGNHRQMFACSYEGVSQKTHKLVSHPALPEHGEHLPTEHTSRRLASHVVCKSCVLKTAKWLAVPALPIWHFPVPCAGCRQTCWAGTGSSRYRRQPRVGLRHRQPARQPGQRVSASCSAPAAWQQRQDSRPCSLCLNTDAVYWEFSSTPQPGTFQEVCLLQLFAAPRGCILLQKFTCRKLQDTPYQWNMKQEVFETPVLT